MKIQDAILGEISISVCISVVSCQKLQYNPFCQLQGKRVVLMEYILYCDESSTEGPKYSDFFGGCLVSAKDLHGVVDALQARKEVLNLHGEIKWTKVTEPYLDKYIQIMELFFSFVKAGKIKVRIMFRRNEDRPSNYHERHSNDDKYFKLYYQFLKNGFGLRYLPVNQEDAYIRIYLDQLPDTKAKSAQFKEFVRGIPNTRDFQDVHGKLHIREGDVAEVRSHDHVLLQCTDIVLGAMFFRLNNLHLEKPAGSRRRGKRTVAKEKLYKYIYSQIQDMLPRFNIGTSTGSHGYEHPSWELPYSHWQFIPY